MEDKIAAAFVCNTGGDGLYTTKKKAVRILNLHISYVSDDENFGSLNVFFDTDTWDTYYDNDIYTDNTWLKEFKDQLQTRFGFSAEAANDVDYSEHGMQGNIYVNLDFGAKFYDAFKQVMATSAITKLTH